MKTYLQVHEIFPWLKGLHMREADYYRASRENTDHPRARMLLEYIESLELEMADHVSVLKTKASRELLNTYYQYIPEQDDANGKAPINITAAQAADLIIERSQRLEAVYLKLAEMGHVASTRQLFSDLAGMIRVRRQQAIESYDHLNDI